MRSLGKAGLGLVATLTIMIFFATSVDARTFRMTGNWRQQRGPNAQIPIIGGINNAPNVLVSATGSQPATLTVPAGAFTGMNSLLLPLPITTIVQLSTMLNFSGPGTVGVMAAGPKTSRPANFAFCAGAAANPNCLNPASANGAQPKTHGLVRYTAGPNQFGGTMQMLLTGGGALAYVVGTNPTRLQHNLFGGNPSGGYQVQGGVYANTNTVFLPGGPVTTGAVCQNGPCAANNGIIIAAGTQTLTSMGSPAIGTDTTNFNTGFPWTTGMVTAIVTTKLPTTNSTLTATGSDSRTDLGLGNITLVAGGILNRSPSTTHSSSLDKVTMTFKAQNLPSMNPAGLAMLVGAISLAAGFATRKRWSRRS